MATTDDPNDPELEEEDDLDQEEIMESGFDLLAFWDEYRQLILLVTGAIILGLAAYGAYTYTAGQRRDAAQAALAAAASEDDYRAVMDKYAGLPAAGNAALLLADKLQTGKRYDDAQQVLQTFLDKNPNHPLAAGAELSIGRILEVQGKTDEALAKYQEISAKYQEPPNYAAPLAMIAQANLLLKSGKKEDARQLYTNFVAQYPDSVFAQQANTELHLMGPAPQQGGSNAATVAPQQQQAPQAPQDNTPLVLRRPGMPAGPAPSVATSPIPATTGTPR